MQCETIHLRLNNVCARRSYVMGGVALQTTLTLSAATRWRTLVSNGSMFGILQPSVSTMNDDRRRSPSSSPCPSSPPVKPGPPSTLSDRRRASNVSDTMKAELRHRTTNVLSVTRRWNIVDVFAAILDDSCYNISRTASQMHRHILRTTLPFSRRQTTRIPFFAPPLYVYRHHSHWIVM